MACTMWLVSPKVDVLHKRSDQRQLLEIHVLSVLRAKCPCLFWKIDVETLQTYIFVKFLRRSVNEGRHFFSRPRFGVFYELNTKTTKRQEFGRKAIHTNAYIHLSFTSGQQVVEYVCKRSQLICQERRGLPTLHVLMTFQPEKPASPRFYEAQAAFPSKNHGNGFVWR